MQYEGVKSTMIGTVSIGEAPLHSQDSKTYQMCHSRRSLQHIPSPRPRTSAGDTSEGQYSQLDKKLRAQVPKAQSLRYKLFLSPNIHFIPKDSQSLDINSHPQKPTIAQWSMRHAATPIQLINAQFCTN